MHRIRYAVIEARIDDGDVPDSSFENGTSALRFDVVDPVAPGAIEALLHAVVECISGQIIPTGAQHVSHFIQDARKLGHYRKETRRRLKRLGWLTGLTRLARLA